MADTSATSSASKNTRTRKQQWALLLGTVGIIGVCVFMGWHRLPHAPRGSVNTVAPRFDSGVDALPAKDLWLHAAEDTVHTHSTQLETLTAATQKHAAHDVDLAKTLDAQHHQIEQLQAQLERLINTPQAVLPDAPAMDAVGSLPVRPELHSSYSALKARTVPKTAKTYVPAGSYVQAVLLSGIDASASVTSQQAPRPILLRLTGRGALPNGLSSQLKDCRVLGAAIGDLSAERAYIRLEQLSCLQLGEYRDFPVRGYVAGRDGKAGVRGRVVMKDGALMSRAFLGGFVGGLSKSAANSLTFQSVSPEGSVSSVKGQDAFAFAGAQGVSDGLSLYAKYQIKRAEQYQPVIEVGSGTGVDLVFTQGFYLDGFRAGRTGTRETTGADFNAQLTLPQPPGETSS